MGDGRELIQAASAGAGSAFSTAALFPIEIVKTLLQASSRSSEVQLHSAVDAARHILRERGVVGFYRGLSARTLEQVARAVVYFYLYTWLRRRAASKASLSTAANLAVGYAAGIGGILFTSPFEIIATRLLTTSEKGATFLSVAKSLLDEGGAAALYRGFGASVVLCINPAIQYTVFDQLKAFILQRVAARHPGKRVALTTAQAFLLGAAAKAIATVVTFPYIRAKVVLQAAKAGRRACPRDAAEAGAAAGSGAGGGGEGEGEEGEGDDPLRVLPSDSAPEVLRKLAAADGVHGWYKGMAPQLLKGVLAAALMLTVKERIELVVRGALRAPTGGRCGTH